MKIRHQYFVFTFAIDEQRCDPETLSQIVAILASVDQMVSKGLSIIFQAIMWCWIAGNIYFHSNIGVFIEFVLVAFIYQNVRNVELHSEKVLYRVFFLNLAHLYFAWVQF